MGKMTKRILGLALVCALLMNAMIINVGAVSNNTNLESIDDTFVRDGQYANDNYGDNALCVVKDGTCSGYTRFAYYKFDISNQNINDVGRVFLKLYGRNNQSGTSLINIYSTSSDWDENNMTWQNKPSSIDYQDSIFVKDEKYYEIEITGAVKKALTTNQDTVSVVLSQKIDEDKTVTFNTKEATQNKPILEYKNGYELVFEDNFTGGNGDSMDLSKWKYRALGPRRDAINIENAVFQDGNGNLVIKTYTYNNKHYTGMIRTIDEWKYGKFEANIDFNSSYGMWSAFWVQSPTMGNPIGNPGQAGIEIDVVEHLKNADNTTQINLHWDGYGSAHKHKGHNYNGAAIGTGFHKFTLEWTPDKYKIFVDGELAWVTDSPISHTEEYIILSSEVQNNSWAGSIPSAGYGNLNNSNTDLKVDYVRVYQ